METNNAYRHIFFAMVLPILAGIAIYSLMSLVSIATRGPIICEEVYSDDTVSVMNCTYS